ncbi:MAG: OmpA family protein [Terrimicrobiaceae bacterium]
MILKLTFCVVVLALAGCDRPKDVEASATPSPTPAASPEAPAGTVGIDVETPGAVEEVTAAAEVKMDVEDDEIQLVKAEVLSRIDVMPKLSDEEKDKLYVQVERARGMGKLMSVPFATGQKTLTPTHINALKEKLLLPQFASFKDDPTVVFVVLGFADKAGDPAKNLTLSRDRASAVVDTLKQSCGIMNVTHSVGMGSSEMFDAASLEKNRIVEIWAVLP